MNKKMIALAIIPIIGLIFIISTPDSDTQNSSNDIAETIPTPQTTLPVAESSEFPLHDCSGNAKCITGIVTKIIDGDTIHVDDQSIRFSLASAPELNGFGGVDSRNFIQTICPVGSKVLVDEDDGQAPEGHSRIIGVVYCNDVILNKELLDANLGYLDSRFCDSSEFGSYSWAQKHGCLDISSSDPDASG
jgi:micrococcal nuclease